MRRAAGPANPTAVKPAGDAPATAGPRAAVAGNHGPPFPPSRRPPCRRRAVVRLSDGPVSRLQQRFLPPCRHRPSPRPRRIPLRRRSLRLHHGRRLLGQPRLAFRPPDLPHLQQFRGRRHDPDRPQGADDRRPGRGDAAHRPFAGKQPVDTGRLRRPGGAGDQSPVAAATDLLLVLVSRTDLLAAGPAAQSRPRGGTDARRRAGPSCRTG